MEAKAPTPEVLRRLGEANWEKIYPQLVTYALNRAKELYWRTGSHQDLAEGKNPEDLVNEAIQKVFEGTRAWDPEKDSDLATFLKYSVLKSMFNVLARSGDNILVDKLKTRCDEEGGLEDPPNIAAPEAPHAYELGSKPPIDPELKLLLKEDDDAREMQAKQHVSALFEEAKNDEEVSKLLESMMEGITKPQEIATYTDLRIEQVYNAQKRLRRMAKNLRFK